MPYFRKNAFRSLKNLEQRNGSAPNIWRGKSWSKAKCCWAESDSQIVKRFIEFPSTRARHAHSLKNHAYIQPCITNIHQNDDLAILIISRRAVATSSSPGGYDVVGHGDHDDDHCEWRAVASSTSLASLVAMMLLVMTIMVMIMMMMTMNEVQWPPPAPLVAIIAAD